MTGKRPAPKAPTREEYWQQQERDIMRPRVPGDQPPRLDELGDTDRDLVEKIRRDREKRT